MKNLVNTIAKATAPVNQAAIDLHNMVVLDGQSVKAEYLAQNEAFMSFRNLLLSAKDVLADTGKARLLLEDITKTFQLMQDELMAEILETLSPEKRAQVESLSAQCQNLKTAISNEELKLQALADTGKGKKELDAQQKVIDKIRADYDTTFEQLKGLVKVSVDGKTRDFPNMTEKARIRCAIINNVRKAAYGGQKGQGDKAVKAKGHGWNKVATELKGCYSLRDLRLVSSSLVPAELQKVVSKKATEEKAVHTSNGAVTVQPVQAILKAMETLPTDNAEYVDVSTNVTLKSAVRLLGVIIAKDIPPSNKVAADKLKAAIDTLNQLIAETAKLEAERSAKEKAERGAGEVVNVVNS